VLDEQDPAGARDEDRCMDERAARARLVAEQEATARRVAAMTDELAAVAAAAAGSNLDDEHDPEGSTIAFEREQLAALRAQAGNHLREVDAAIARLDEGRYGRCESCGRSIGEARLGALPATRLCVRCAARRRP
jgi:RNA polymerase-binding transcription factor DksA